MNNLKRLKIKTGLSIYSILGLLLVTLKVTNQVDISWFWATFPFWIGIASVISLCIFILIIGLAIIIIKSILE
jgi:hypothetical protein